MSGQTCAPPGFAISPATFPVPQTARVELAVHHESVAEQIRVADDALLAERRAWDVLAVGWSMRKVLLVISVDTGERDGEKGTNCPRFVYPSHRCCQE